jgi:hypothetical protein
LPCPEIAIHKKHPYAKYIETREADFLSFSPNGSASGETKIVKVANATDKAVDAVNAIKANEEGKSKSPEMVQTVKDSKDPNKNQWVRKDVINAQQKKKNEN